MNPFRAQVVSVLSQVGTLPASEISEKTDHNVKVLKRDLQPAVDAGLLTPDDSDIPAATYHYIPPTDPAAERGRYDYSCPNSGMASAVRPRRRLLAFAA